MLLNFLGLYIILYNFRQHHFHVFKKLRKKQIFPHQPICVHHRFKDLPNNQEFLSDIFSHQCIGRLVRLECHIFLPFIHHLFFFRWREVTVWLSPFGQGSDHKKFQLCCTCLCLQITKYIYFGITNYQSPGKEKQYLNLVKILEVNSAMSYMLLQLLKGLWDYYEMYKQGNKHESKNSIILHECLHINLAIFDDQGSRNKMRKRFNRWGEQITFWLAHLCKCVVEWIVTLPHHVS